MVTQRVQMKGIFPWLVRWACRAVTRDFCSALTALVGPVRTKYFFPHRTLLKFLCPHRSASWAGRHAGSPVSKYVSLLSIFLKLKLPRNRRREVWLLRDCGGRVGGGSHLARQERGARPYDQHQVSCRVTHPAG
jgi:hypothetical protein